MSRDVYRVAIIGLGVIGWRMLTNMTKHDGFSPVMGFDLSADARKKAAADFAEALAVQELIEATIAAA